MTERDSLARGFEEHRPRLRSMAYNMLGSVADADDAVQESWVRLDRSDAEEIDNLGGWLTTVVGRLCLDTLRRRTTHAEPHGLRLSDPVVAPWDGGVDPETEALAADALGLALLVVLDALSPAERLAFVLHDVFAVPFDRVADVVGHSEPAARKLASRARHKVRAVNAEPDADHATQREAVDAFVTAARGGDITALLEVLDPEVVVRADHGGAGVVVGPPQRPRTVMAFTVRGRTIAAIDILTDRERLRALLAGPAN